MEASPVTPRANLDLVHERRRSLNVAARKLEDALAQPGEHRIETWKADVDASLQDLRARLAEHKIATEGPRGFHADVVAAAPRLAHEVSLLVDEHVALHDHARSLATEIEGAADRSGVEAVREDGARLLALLNKHRQRGADLIYEAYERDLGVGD